MPDIFISDLHLEAERQDITSALTDFLNSEPVVSADNLYILGDLFEVWLGDDAMSAFHKDIADLLAAVPAPIFLMHGNRDFLMGEAFCAAIGATLLPDPIVREIAGKPVLLMHGDSLCTRDEAYMQARSMLRNPEFQKDFLAKPILEREAFARAARNQSAEHTRDTAMDIMDVTPMEVVNIMEEHQVDLLIHGHTHRPNVHQLEVSGANAQRMVLGDWDKKGWYLAADQGQFELQSFSF